MHGLRGPPLLLLPPTAGRANRIQGQSQTLKRVRSEYADYPVATAPPDFSVVFEGLLCCVPDIQSKTGDAMKTEL